MSKIESKLTFEIGEEVVICGQQIGLFTCNCPNKNNFCFTTIKEVKEDGSVVVEEGYRYRQSYEKDYDTTYYHDYFKIYRKPSNQCFTNFNGTEYKDSGNGYSCDVRAQASFVGLTFLFKMSEDFKLKVLNIQRKYVEKQAQEKKRREEFEKKQVFIKAYEEEFKELEELLAKKKAESFRKHVCGNCAHKCGSMCNQWDRNINETDCTMCSAFEL